MTPYRPADDRYDRTPDGWFRRCGNSGLRLPALSLGCWHNFGDAGTDPRQLPEAEFHANARAMLTAAFDHGITHFDLANNYGPAPGSAELRVGRILREDFAGHRDELIISTKAGYRMWPGPYGEFGSRKYLLASLDQSLDRLGLDYVDLFYSHRPDPDTPLEETLGALDSAVRSGKTLYVGISSYSGEMTRRAIDVCEQNGLVKPIIHQPNYSMLNRGIEEDLLPATGELGLGVIAFCPLAQGLLTPKYLKVDANPGEGSNSGGGGGGGGGVPEDSRAKQASGFLQEDRITPELVRRLNALNEVAEARGQSLAQLALVWALRDPRMTSLVIGASRPSQIEQNVAAFANATLSDEELSRIDGLLAEA
jgi:L-glyceraldehyde 3-phosphate reductase